MNLSIFSAPATASQAVTMSSREIAELTGKELSNVHRDIRSMIDSLCDDNDSVLNHVKEDKDARGYTAAFHLNKDLTLTLVAGYSAKLRLSIIRRWQELEAKVAHPQPVALTQAEQDIRVAVLLADALNVAPSGRITMLGVALKHSAPHMLAALPAYAIDAPAQSSAPQSSKLTAQDIADSALLGNIESPFNACMHQEHCKRWKEQAQNHATDAGNMVPTGWRLLPVEPTHEIISAMLESEAQDDEGKFPTLFDLLNFSGANKALMVVAAAYRAMLAAAPQPPIVENMQPDTSPYLYYDPKNGETWTNEAIIDGCCPPDGLIALYTKDTK